MKISKIASMIIFGSAIIFIGGCGSSGSTSTSTISGTVSDAYVVGAQICIDENNDSICEPNEKIVAKTDANGKFSIPASYKNYNLATVGGIDIATGEKVETLALKAGSGKLNVTPITTFLANFDGNDTEAARILGISESSLYNDPVADPSGESTKGTLKLNAAKNLAGSTYADLAATGEDNLSKAVKNINPDVNETVADKLFKQIDEINVSGDIKNKELAEQAVVVAAQVAKKGKDVNLTEIHTLVQQVDNNVTVNNPVVVVATLTHAVENNITDPNKIVEVVKTVATVAEENSTIIENPDAVSVIAQTVVENPDINISDINISDIVKKVQPVSYTSNIITIGDQQVKFEQIGDTEVASFYVEKNVTSDTTYQDFANIKLPDVNLSTLEGKDGTYDASLVLTIKDLQADNTVVFRINNAEIDINNSADNKFEIKFIPGKTKLAVYQKGLQNLSKIASGETKVADIKNELVNTDLEFNINTLINDLSTNDDSIAITLNELNSYLIRSREYKVTLTVDTTLPLQINTLTGSVKVINIEEIESTSSVSSTNTTQTIPTEETESTSSVSSTNTTQTIPIE